MKLKRKRPVVYVRRKQHESISKMFDNTPAPTLPAMATSGMIFTDNDGKRIIVPEGRN